MKTVHIKKILILIAFVAISVLLGQVSQAAACNVNEVCDQNSAGTYVPTTPTAYTPPMANPSLYANATNGYNANQAPVYAYNYPQNGGYQAYGYGQNNAPVAQQNYAVSQPTYVPGSPIIAGRDGTYTEQLTGKRVSTGSGVATPASNSPTTTQNSNSTSSTTTSTNESPSLLSGIFGSGKSVFSGSNSSNAVADQNLQATVNSKGLAMGTNSTCSDSFDYLVLYKNVTGTTINNVAIRVSLPTGVTPTNTNQGSYSERDNTLTFFIGTLTKDQSGQILINTKLARTISGFARSELVYTLPNQTQGMIESYAFANNNTCSGNRSSLGASAAGSGLFGGTLLGWLFLALFVCAFIYLIRFFLIRKTASHGHGHDAHH